MSCKYCGWEGQGDSTYTFHRPWEQGIRHQYICKTCKEIFEYNPEYETKPTCPICRSNTQFKHWRIASGCPKCQNKLTIEDVCFL